jgi:sulfide dehydrogenase cytochrome subunit
MAQTIANGARRIVALLMATSPFVFAVYPGALAENNRGAHLAAMCASCHRLDGRDRGIPSIVGIDKKKLVDTMEDFKSGKRSSQIMQVVARTLSTEEIAVLADYLAARQKGSEQP